MPKQIFSWQGYQKLVEPFNYYWVQKQQYHAGPTYLCHLLQTNVVPHETNIDLNDY